MLCAVSSRQIIVIIDTTPSLFEVCGKMKTILYCKSSKNIADMFNNKEHNNFKLNLHFKFKHIFYEEEKEN